MRPDLICEELEHTFELISLPPKIGAKAQNTDLASVRRIHLARIHYRLYYRATQLDVEVLVFWHSSRSSTPRLQPTARSDQPQIL
jgi:plasmid stabilization system protein ParE